MSKQRKYIQKIHQCYPDIEVQSVKINDLGQYNDVLIVNDHLIFRFPKFAEGINELATETAILEGIQDQVSLEIPKPIYHNLKTSVVGEVFVGYEMIKGEPLWRETVSSITEETVLEKLATQIATFLKELHNISVEDSIAVSLPLVDTREEWLDLYKRIQAKLYEFMRPAAKIAVTEHFERYLDAPDTFAFEPTLRHGDFGTVNLLYDKNTQSISGVIDFGSAGLGDPAVDFAGIISPVGYGESFLKRFESVYPNIDATAQRTKFYVGIFALQEALYGVEHNDREAFEAGIENYR